MLHEEYLGKQVIIRTYSAGVHYGTLAAKDGSEVKLTTARRIWRWDGTMDAQKPYTLHEVSQIGVGSAARVSCEVPSIVITAIEIIPCATASVAQIASIREWK